jgi:hypothetical protein
MLRSNAQSTRSQQAALTLAVFTLAVVKLAALTPCT